ncbi:small VCP/p97-interacting protein [Macrobrachium rosenbergii]|uniref:small VCP/p97-interacting protein n=1 Tax=Macrobrachium rosenbergii TaxID=79674 RepID=UPI0034D67A99
MGLFVSCCKGEATEYNSFGKSPAPGDPEERRRQMAEAAEKRLKAQEGRGLKDPEALKQRQKRQEELEQKEKELAGASEGGLRWQVN